MNYAEYHYIPLNNDSKRPMYKFGGWPVDPNHEHVYTYEETQDIDHRNWAIIGHESSNLLVIDVDLYKMDDETIEEIDDDGWDGLLDQTAVSQSQSGGLHIYVFIDFDLYDSNLEPIEHVDLKGDIGKGYAVAPFSPGYELVQEKDPMPISPNVFEELPVIREAVDPPDLAAGLSWRDALDHKSPCVEYAEDIVREREMDMYDDAVTFLKRYYRHISMMDDEIAENLEESDFMEYASNRDYIHIHELIDSSTYPEGERVEHPPFLHDTPSESKANFMVDEGGETFRCWRHDVTGNALHLIGVKHDIIDCGEWRSRSLASNRWAEIITAAKDEGFDIDDVEITCEWTQDLGICPFECGRPYPSQGI